MKYPLSYNNLSHQTNLLPFRLIGKYINPQDKLFFIPLFISAIFKHHLVVIKCTKF